MSKTVEWLEQNLSSWELSEWQALELVKQEEREEWERERELERAMAGALRRR